MVRVLFDPVFEKPDGDGWQAVLEAAQAKVAAELEQVGHVALQVLHAHTCAHTCTHMHVAQVPPYTIHPYRLSSGCDPRTPPSHPPDLCRHLRIPSTPLPTGPSRPCSGIRPTPYRRRSCLKRSRRCRPRCGRWSRGCATVTRKSWSCYKC
jgi:hypothetical protein